MKSVAGRLLEELRKTKLSRKINEENLDPSFLWRNLVEEKIAEKRLEREDEVQVRKQARECENTASSLIAQMYEEDITSDRIMDALLSDNRKDKQKFYIENRKGAELGRMLDELFAWY